MYAKISGSLSLGRKLFRVGFSLEDFGKFIASLCRCNTKIWTVDAANASLRSFVNIFYWLLDNWCWAQKMEMFTIADTARVNRARIAAWFASVLLAVYPTLQAVSRVVYCHVQCSSSLIIALSCCSIVLHRLMLRQTPVMERSSRISTSITPTLWRFDCVIVLRCAE